LTCSVATSAWNLPVVAPASSLSWGTALSGNGNINRVTFQGTYVVNPDCTGDMTLYVSPFGSTVNLDFVIDDNGNELRAIVTGAGVVETRVYRKQVSRQRED
jgi:hypothetical protein